MKEEVLKIKEEITEIINELQLSIQSMREHGEDDLRTVLHLIDSAENKIERVINNHAY